MGLHKAGPYIFRHISRKPELQFLLWAAYFLYAICKRRYEKCCYCSTPWRTENLERKRITQKALADHKVSGERYISALENGERQNPSVLFLVKSSFILDEPPHKFIQLGQEHSGIILSSQQLEWNGCKHRCKCECRYARLQLACVLRILVFAPYDQD